MEKANAELAAAVEEVSLEHNKKKEVSLQFVRHQFLRYHQNYGLTSAAIVSFLVLFLLD